ncbi:hypothetical protein IQ273_10085 [Nodosilinea sp. LEGE 07298]|jgi:hypothetical protein|uniref:hypothetical protein n=1 Tax=Nodosilinea sp. LEGE 07298 TaxID=2777970 RepID=UPI00187E1D06|nr:hypothetical protein [Nodosilinea sp. LEGE 07298]MBE9109760.1 hypothetical protein [Nodosilinea sp. LEGE 07298]
MNPSTDLSSRLQTAIDLAQHVQQHPEAHQAFQDMLADLKTQSPEAADLLAQLWQEYVSSKRSSLFWEQLSEVEKNLSDRLSESHMQLKQNYLRLMQEQ